MSERRRHQYWRAALAGLGAGAIALCFQRLLESAEAVRTALLIYLHSSAPSWGWCVLPVLSGIVGVLVGWVTFHCAPEASGSGIPHVKGVLMHVSTLSWRRILPIKFLGGVLVIGSGFSLGREGPTVQMGAAVASLLADALRVPAKAAPRLMACGAGAGLAAAFHAPLAGFIFTIEELQREFSSLTYAMALIAAVVADIVTTSFWGNANAFHVAGFPAVSLRALPICALVGAISGLCGAAFNKALLEVQKQSHERFRIAAPTRAGIAGVLVGAVAWLLPDAVGGGHRIAEGILHGQFTATASVNFLLLLFAAKFLLTVASYVSGVPGGIFAPMLVMGACLGLVTGVGASAIVPYLAPQPVSFAAIGMAAFFSAVVRAPLTGIVLVLEMTGDYEQLLPVLTASMIAYVISEKLGIDPIYDALLAYDLQRKQPDVPQHREPILLEFAVQEGSQMDGQRIRDVPLPERCLFVTIARHGSDILPNGNTILQRGDHITAVLSGEGAANAVVRLLPLSKV